MFTSAISGRRSSYCGRACGSFTDTPARAAASLLGATGSVLNQAKRHILSIGSAPLSAWIGLAYLLFCLLVQVSTGALQASFVAYPDEASHFVSAVMVRDWLLSGRWSAPFHFAQDYYLHYPFFGVGYWPPAFSAVTAFVFLAIGVGRQQALFHTPEQLLDHFRQNPVKLIIWHESPEGPRTAHERILGDMLRQNPLEWREVGALRAGDGATSWAIYEQVSLRKLR